MATPKKVVSQTPESLTPPICRGLDVGTANIVEAHGRFTDGVYDIENEAIRDCFVAFDKTEAATLRQSGVRCQAANPDQFVVVGEDAMRVASAMGVEVRRPLANGFISDKEELGKDVVKLLLERVLGVPKVANELVAFSIPGVPLGGDAAKASFHTRFFEDRIRELGFRPVPVNEAAAIGFYALTKHRAQIPGAEKIEGADTQRAYTGLCISFGAGLTNVALVYQGMPSRAFSLPFGGDYIDETVAKATNTPVSSVTTLKEEGIDLMAVEKAKAKGIHKEEPNYIIERRGYHDATCDRQAESISLVYRDLLDKLRDGIQTFFSDPKNRVDIREVIPVVIAGGTASAPGFLDLFNKIVMKNLNIRLALAPAAVLSDFPMTAVASGAICYARMIHGVLEDEEDEKFTVVDGGDETGG